MVLGGATATLTECDVHGSVESCGVWVQDEGSVATLKSCNVHDNPAGPTHEEGGGQIVSEESQLLE